MQRRRTPSPWLWTAVLLLALATGSAARADVVIGGTTVSFASAEEGRKVLTQRDDFVAAMSPFDRAARLKTDKQVSEQEYLQFVGRNVTQWPAADLAKVQAALESLKKPLAALQLPLPKRVLMIRTTGKEEGGAAYTRGAAIVLPAGEIRRPPALLVEILAHEFFHVLSRANPELREKAYAAIGFKKCNEIALPAGLAARKITNPDAPHNDHYIVLRVGDQAKPMVPVLLSKSDKYDTARGGEFFNYMEFKWLVVESADGKKFAPVLHDGQAELLDMQDVAGLQEQVGRNTTYLIHPEEILADNFKLLVLGKKARSPEILAKLREALGVKPEPKP